MWKILFAFYISHLSQQLQIILKDWLSFLNCAFVNFIFRMAGVNKFKTNSGAFKPPNIPKTPSNTINSMLETRCGKEHTNAGKAALAYYICGVFQVCFL